MSRDTCVVACIDDDKKLRNIIIMCMLDSTHSTKVQLLILSLFRVILVNVNSRIRAKMSKTSGDFVKQIPK